MKYETRADYEAMRTRAIYFNYGRVEIAKKKKVYHIAVW